MYQTILDRRPRSPPLVSCPSDNDSGTRQAPRAAPVTAGYTASLFRQTRQGGVVSSVKTHPASTVVCEKGKTRTPLFFSIYPDTSDILSGVYSERGICFRNHCGAEPPRDTRPPRRSQQSVGESSYVNWICRSRTVSSTCVCCARPASSESASGRAAASLPPETWNRFRVTPGWRPFPPVLVGSLMVFSQTPTSTRWIGQPRRRRSDLNTAQPQTKKGEKK